MTSGAKGGANKQDGVFVVQDATKREKNTAQVGRIEQKCRTCNRSHCCSPGIASLISKEGCRVIGAPKMWCGSGCLRKL